MENLVDDEFGRIALRNFASTDTGFTFICHAIRSVIAFLFIGACGTTPSAAVDVGFIVILDAVRAGNADVILT